MSHNLGTEVVAWFIHLPIIANWRSHITKFSQNRALTQHFLKFWKLHYFLLVISPANHGTLFFQRSERTCFVTPCMSLVVTPPCMCIVHIAKKGIHVCGHDGGGLGKGELYHDQHPINAFLSFVIELFGYLHQQVNFFFVDVLMWHG